MLTFEELWEARQVYGPVMIGTDAYATLEEAVRATRALRYIPTLRVRGNAHILGDCITPPMVKTIDEAMRARGCEPIMLE